MDGPGPTNYRVISKHANLKLYPLSRLAHIPASKGKVDEWIPLLTILSSSTPPARMIISHLGFVLLCLIAPMPVSHKHYPASCVHHILPVNVPRIPQLLQICTSDKINLQPESALLLQYQAGAPLPPFDLSGLESFYSYFPRLLRALVISLGRTLPREIRPSETATYLIAKDIARTGQIHVFWVGCKTTASEVQAPREGKEIRMRMSELHIVCGHAKYGRGKQAQSHPDDEQLQDDRRGGTKITPQSRVVVHGASERGRRGVSSTRMRGETKPPEAGMHVSRKDETPKAPLLRNSIEIADVRELHMEDYSMQSMLQQTRRARVQSPDATSKKAGRRLHIRSQAGPRRTTRKTASLHAENARPAEPLAPKHARENPKIVHPTLKQGKKREAKDRHSPTHERTAHFHRTSRCSCCGKRLMRVAVADGDDRGRCGIGGDGGPVLPKGARPRRLGSEERVSASCMLAN
ncbi:hypothetical protein B0H13DRAFT_1877739 [Mycena leptocephala]|nr:hypothetical protein B0H13DRAFT_1877739 [Mycena leptocephala]